MAHARSGGSKGSILAADFQPTRLGRKLAARTDPKPPAIARRCRHISSMAWNKLRVFWAPLLPGQALRKGQKRSLVQLAGFSPTTL